MSNNINCTYSRFTPLQTMNFFQTQFGSIVYAQSCNGILCGPAHEIFSDGSQIRFTYVNGKREGQAYHSWPGGPDREFWYEKDIPYGFVKEFPLTSNVAVSGESEESVLSTVENSSISTSQAPKQIPLPPLSVLERIEKIDIKEIEKLNLNGKNIKRLI